MTTPVAAGYPSDPARDHGTMKQVMENLLSCIKEGYGGNAPYAVTMAGDAFTPPNNYGTFVISAETGTADNLANISPLNIPSGRICVFGAAAGHTITFKHGAGGTGQLSLLQAADKAISGDAKLFAMYDSATTTWKELDRNFAAVFPSAAANLFMATPLGSSGHWVQRAIGVLDLDVNYILHKIIGQKAKSSKTLSSDVLTPLASDSALIEVGAESGTADDLKLLDSTNLWDGIVLRLRAKSTDTITVKHLGSGGTGNQRQIKLQNAADLTLSGDKFIDVMLVGTIFYEVFQSGSSVPSYMLRFGGQNSATSLRGLLSVPGAPTVTPQGTGGAATWSYKVVIRDVGGTVTAASAAGTTTAGNATLTGVNFNRITFTLPTGCVADVYRTAHGTSPATDGKIATGLTAGTFDDTGVAGDGSTAPTVTTFVGEYWHVGDWTSDVAFTATRMRLHIIGNFTLNHAMTVSTEMKGGLGGAGTTTAAANGGFGQGPGGGGGGQQGYSGFYAGGGGGANGGAGGMGGFNATGGSGRNGGQTYSIEHFLPGSGGGGGMGTASGAAGGNGGGCFYMEGTGNFTIGASGSITANGTAGAAGDAAANGGGAGGGSGGTVAFVIGGNFSLHASATITCNGGNGGNAATANGPGGGGGGGGKAWGRVGGSSTVSGTISLSGGSAGTGVGSGSNGTAGSAGAADIQAGINYSVRTAA